jgi:hypothetical protein
MIEISIDVVGVDTFKNLSDPNLWDQMKSKMLNDIGILTVKSIHDEIRTKQWKSSPEALINTTTYRVEGDSVTVRTGEATPGKYNYAVAQELGVERHEMRYLLKSKRPIPLMIGKFNNSSKQMGVMIFRTATERWMGVPHTVNGPTVAKIGRLINGRLVKPKTKLWEHQPYDATGWVHPGFPGKFFFRDGIKKAMVEVTRQMKGLTLRVAYADPYYDINDIKVEGSMGE